MKQEATIKEQYQALMDVVPTQATLAVAALLVALGKAMHGFSLGDPNLEDVFGLVGAMGWLIAIASAFTVSAHSEAIKQREAELVRARLRREYGDSH